MKRFILYIVVMVVVGIYIKGGDYLMKEKAREIAKQGYISEGCLHLTRENSYKNYILCSITSPTMISGGGVFVLPLNSKEGFTDANINDGILYGQICHNERQYNLVEKYKYNVKGYDTFNNSTPDFFGGLDVQ